MVRGPNMNGMKLIKDLQGGDLVEIRMPVVGAVDGPKTRVPVTLCVIEVGPNTYSKDGGGSPGNMLVKFVMGDEEYVQAFGDLAAVRFVGRAETDE